MKTSRNGERESSRSPNMKEVGYKRTESHRLGSSLKLKKKSYRTQDQPEGSDENPLQSSEDKQRRRK